MADPTAGGDTEGLPKCSKPVCGALRLIGQPCTDWDCPQQWVSAAEHRSALARASAEQARVEAAEANLNALARMYGEACGNLAQYRHAAVEWQGEQVDYAAAFESRVASLTAALALAAERLDVAAAQITWGITAFGVREWAKEARAALREPQPTPEAPDAL